MQLKAEIIRNMKIIAAAAFRNHLKKLGDGSILWIEISSRLLKDMDYMSYSALKCLILLEIIFSFFFLTD